MISADNYVKVRFDDEGKQKIADAYETLRSIVDAMRKAGGMTEDVEEIFDDAAYHLDAILNGKEY